MGILPAKSSLLNATIQVLSESKEPIKASEINNRVAILLAIPDDVLAIEDANCTGTEFSYQMRWIRTNLKNKGIITNPERGYWKISD